MKIKTVILNTFIIILLSTITCFGQSSKYDARSNGHTLYYVIKSINGEGNKSFNLFTAKADHPENAFYLNTFTGNPLVTTEHDGDLVAFYQNGSVLGYSKNSRNTYQSFDNSYTPIDAASLNSKLYLLAEKENEYVIFDISHNVINQVVNLGSKLQTVSNSRMFYYDKRVYLAGQNSDGSIFCDAIDDNGFAGLDITINDNLANFQIADILTANRTVVFILTDKQNNPQYYTATFINNQLNGKQKLDIDDLPDFTSETTSFVICADDFAFTVLKDNVLHIQKYDIAGNKIGDMLNSYELSVIDSSNNSYIQGVTIALLVIIIVTIILGLKKALAGGELPKTAQGLPAPITFRVPAFLIDMFCISFVMDGIIAILGQFGIVDQERIMFTMEQFQSQLQNSSAINIDIAPILLAMGVLYLIILIYFSIFEWLMSATPGKMLFSLKVADYETLAAGNTGLLRIVVRNIYRIIELLPLILPVIVLVMMISPRKQRPGDMAARTTIILTRIPGKPKTGAHFDKEA